MSSNDAQPQPNISVRMPFSWQVPAWILLLSVGATLLVPAGTALTSDHEARYTWGLVLVPLVVTAMTVVSGPWVPQKSGGRSLTWLWMLLAALALVGLIQLDVIAFRLPALVGLLLGLALLAAGVWALARFIGAWMAKIGAPHVEEKDRKYLAVPGWATAFSIAVTAIVGAVLVHVF